MHIRWLVMTLKDRQLARVKALRAEADAIDAQLAQRREIFHIDRCRIRLDRPLFQPAEIEPLAQAGEQFSHQLFRKQRRRAPAEEDRARTSTSADRRLEPDA